MYVLENTVRIVYFLLLFYSEYNHKLKNTRTVVNHNTKTIIRVTF